MTEGSDYNKASPSQVGEDRMIISYGLVDLPCPNWITIKAKKKPFHICIYRVEQKRSVHLCESISMKQPFRVDEQFQVWGCVEKNGLCSYLV